MRTFLIAATVIFIIASDALLAQTTIFFDDFESYPLGSNLIGQNGWIGYNGPGEPGPPIVRIDLGSPHLTTQVVNGRANVNVSQQTIAEHFVPINPALITTLMFDADSLPTFHNQFVAIDSFGPGVGDRVQWGIDATGANGPGWYFGPGESQGNWLAPGGTNQKVLLGVVLDGPANQVYGLYDFTGGGLIQTPHFLLSDARHATLNGVHIYIDHRGNINQGIQVDNILVSEVPEPTAGGIILALGIGAVGSRVRVKKIQTK